MPEFTLSASCTGSAEEVWKLLYDPFRFSEWWCGTTRVEDVTDDTAVRYVAEWPDFPYPTRVTTRSDGVRVVISCLLSDIVQEWTLEPAGRGCTIRLHVEVPPSEAGRLAAVQGEMEASMPRLVAAAEHADGARDAPAGPPDRTGTA